MTAARLRCAITGPTEGVGKATARALALQHGMDLVLLCRNADKGAQLAGELAASAVVKIDVVTCDLSSLASVGQAARELLSRYDRLDVLINNAGVICNQRQLSADGHELMFATNHLGPFLLSMLALPLLRSAPAPRMVNVSSGAHAFVRGVDFDNLEWQRGFRTFPAYGQSKLCNILFTRELCRREEGAGIAINAVHPGAVFTNLGHNNGRYVKWVYNLARPFFRSPEQGAASSIWLASSTEGGTLRGEYVVDCKQATPKPWALDDVAARRLWDISCDLTGLAR